MLLQRFATPRVSRFPQLRLVVPRDAVRPAWRRERDGNAADGGVAWRPAAYGHPHAVMSRASDRALRVVVRGAGTDIVALPAEFTVFGLVAAIPFPRHARSAGGRRVRANRAGQRRGDRCSEHSRAVPRRSVPSRCGAPCSAVLSRRDHDPDTRSRRDLLPWEAPMIALIAIGATSVLMGCVLCAALRRRRQTESAYAGSHRLSRTPRLAAPVGRRGPGGSRKDLQR